MVFKRGHNGKALRVEIKRRYFMITNDIPENLGLTQSDLVDYSQLVGKILI